MADRAEELSTEVDPSHHQVSPVANMLDSLMHSI